MLSKYPNDGAEHGNHVASSYQALQFFVYFTLLFFVLDVYIFIAYDRHTVLEIGSFIAHRKPDFEFLNAGALFTNTASEPFVWAARPRKCCRKRGKRAGVPVRLPLGKSDHSSVMLLPAYRQKLKREAPTLRTIQCWSDQSDAILQDCFDHVDWDMFRAASDDDIEAYSDTVTCFIRKCIEDVVPTKTICIYPNQNPWINSDVRAALSGRKSAFKSSNTDNWKQASYDLRKSIKATKRQYKNKVEEQFNTNNARASTTSQVLKGINQLLWTLPPLYQTSLIIFMLVSWLTIPPTQRALLRLLQKRWVHSRFMSRM